MLTVKLLHSQLFARFLGLLVKFLFGDFTLEEMLVDPGYVAYRRTVLVDGADVVLKELATAIRSGITSHAWDVAHVSATVATFRTNPTH